METKCAVQVGWLPEVYADSKPALVAYTGGPFRCVMNTSLRAFQEEARAYCRHICMCDRACQPLQRCHVVSSARLFPKLEIASAPAERRIGLTGSTYVCALRPSILVRFTGAGTAQHYHQCLKYLDALRKFDQKQCLR